MGRFETQFYHQGTKTRRPHNSHTSFSLAWWRGGLVVRSRVRARRQYGLALMLTACALFVLTPFSLHAAALGTAQLEIVAVDSSRLPTVDVTVQVRDASGHGVSGLNAAAFSIEEQGRTIPGEQVHLAESQVAAGSLSVAIVADTSALLGSQATAQIRADTRSLITQLTDQAGSTGVGLFVPRGSASTTDQRIEALPFTNDRSAALAAVDQLGERRGQTDLYNAVVAAITASADAAAQRGGPAYVVVLSDGLDRTSIVGAGQNGANEAARIAEERRVRVVTLGYGAALRRGSPLLTQLADRAAGSYQANPSAEQLGALAAELRNAASGGTYTLRFASALPADGAEHPLIIRTRLNDQNIDAASQVLAPRLWDNATPLQTEFQLDAQQYPKLHMTVRPINRLRRTVPNLASSDLQLTLDGAPISMTLALASQPLDARAPAAAQSVALVVNQGGPSASSVREQASSWLQVPDDLPSRVALFVPGAASGTPQFTHDHNANINALNAAATSGPRGELGATLLQAIDAAARDGDAAKRPAYVLLFSDQALAPGERARAATLARDLGVTVATVATTAEIDSSLAPLAAATGASNLVAPGQAALRELAQQIQQDHATTYLVTGEMPMVADGRQHTLGLTLRGLSTKAPFAALVPGEPTVRMPITPAALGFLALGLGLLLASSAFLPRLAYERRRRCATCGRFRRASWGNSCLFCERELASGVSSHASELPLAGFAQQGASILQNSLVTPLRPVSTANEFPANAEAPQPTNTDFWGPLPASDSELELRAAAYAFEQPDANRSHTDFWGAIPQTAALAGDDGRQTMDDGQQADGDSEEPIPVPLLPQIAPVTAVPNAAMEAISAPAEERPVSSETGFWGPIEPLASSRKEAKS